MPRPAHIAFVLLVAPHLAAAAPLAAPPGRAAAAMQVVRGLVEAAGAQHCRVIGYRLLRDGYETLIDADFMARRTPGARVAITVSCEH